MFTVDRTYGKNQNFGLGEKEHTFLEAWNMKKIQEFNRSFIPLLKLLESLFVHEKTRVQKS